uniref:Uncharacterized protein n=1 Tax=Vitis vinifera TaxID=29760 RepID=F6GSS4_VITVI
MSHIILEILVYETWPNCNAPLSATHFWACGY